MTEQKQLCSICGMKYEGFGHNAAPLNDGRCCYECNATIVIPARLALLIRKQEQKIK